MKSILVFILCGITCCCAAPSCSEDDLMKCMRSQLDESATEEELLERDCKHAECIIKLYERCGVDVFPKPKIPDYFPEKGYRKLLNSVCVKTNPLRKKYLDTATCSRNAIYEYGNRNGKLFEDCGIAHNTREEFCRRIPAGLQCVVDYLTRECGPDAGEAYPYGNAIHYDPYDCLQ